MGVLRRPCIVVSALGSGALATMLVACAADDELELLERFAVASSQPAFEGRFETRIATLLDGSARTIHVLVAPPQELTISLDASVEIPRDAVVRVWGSELEDGVLEVESYEVVSWPPQPLIDADPRPHRRIATVLLSWQGETVVSNSAARERMFAGSDSTNALYGENSHGVERLAGNVLGPYQVAIPPSCDPSQIRDLGMAELTADGHAETDYRQFMWVFPGNVWCDWTSLASQGTFENPGRDSWFAGAFDCRLRARSLGVNFGMRNSHAYTQCTEDGIGVPYSDDCAHVEFGHPHDFMGNWCAHTNVVQKAFMGWLDDCNVVRATADGTFNLSPTELPCNGTQALRFPTYDGRDYWLEYRRPLGFDSHLGGGVLVHVSEEVGPTGPSSYLLRMSGSWFLPVGEPYTDPGGTVTFTVVEQHETHAVIAATFPDGGSGAPVCRDGSSPELAEGVVGTLECADEPYPIDTVPPSVQIVAPEDGSVFAAGSSFELVAEASDDRGVTELELFVSIDGGDATKMGSLFDPTEGCEGAPGQVCPWTWSVSDIPAGKYEFGVRAWDGPNWTGSWEVDGKAHIIHVEGEPDDADETTGGDETAGTHDEATGDTDGEPEHADAAEQGCACLSGAGEVPTFGLAWLVLAALGARRRRVERA
jgi:hypothetical protein